MSTTTQQPTCLIGQAHCGRVAGNPVCPKCGADEQVRYTTPEAMMLATAQASAQYWQSESAEMAQRSAAAEAERQELERQIVQEPKRQADNEQLEAVQLGEAKAAQQRAEEELQRLAGELAQHEERERLREQYKQKAAWAGWMKPTSIAALVLVGAVVGASIYQAMAQRNENTVQQATIPEMVAIHAGSFLMGSPATENGRSSNEGPQRRVSVKAFELGKYEVTQRQWQAVMGSNPSYFSACGDNCPVETVNLNDIQSYIQKLNAKTGRQYRLPSEAEWEYAARAGCEAAFNVGGQCAHKIEATQANFDGSRTYNGSAKGEYKKMMLAVGSFKANNWGLSDMHGNVWEWVADCYENSYSQGQPSDGSAHRGKDSSCSRRVLRGGSWSGSPDYLRSAVRNRHTPGDRNIYLGFRIARTVS